mgnify:CR=1 FL=1
MVSKIAKGLPEGLIYEVAERDANQNGYVTTSENEKGTILADSEVTVAFVNKKESEKPNKPENPSEPENPGKPENPEKPTKTVTSKTEKKSEESNGAVQTGDENSFMIWEILLALSTFGIGSVCLVRRKK